QPVTLTNSGTAPMSFWGMVVSGDFAANYATTTAPCPVSPSTLAVGQSCIINVTFSPTATGTRTGALSVQDTASNSPQTISLTGTEGIRRLPQRPPSSRSRTTLT